MTPGAASGRGAQRNSRGITTCKYDNLHLAPLVGRPSPGFSRFLFLAYYLLPMSGLGISFAFRSHSLAISDSASVITRSMRYPSRLCSYVIVVYRGQLKARQHGVVDLDAPEAEPKKHRRQGTTPSQGAREDH
jgi:hypothetical protein